MVRPVARTVMAPGLEGCFQLRRQHMHPGFGKNSDTAGVIGIKVRQQDMAQITRVQLQLPLIRRWHQGQSLPPLR